MNYSLCVALCLRDLVAIVLKFVNSLATKSPSLKVTLRKTPFEWHSNKRKISILILLTIFFPKINFAQEAKSPYGIDIIPYLKMIESGKKDKAIHELLLLKNKNPNDPNVMFLEGILTEDGKDAVNIYERILKDYPHSRYADASLYRIYSYYFSLGEYDKAKESFQKLKEEYPVSPYLKLAERNIPSKNQLFAEEKNEEKNPPSETEKSEKDFTKEEKTIDYKYTIQAGAFTQSSNALSLKKDFEDNGFFSEIKQKNVGGTTFNVVYVGKFESREEAKNFLHVINTEFKLDGRVVDY